MTESTEISLDVQYLATVNTGFRESLKVKLTCLHLILFSTDTGYVIKPSIM